MIGPDKRKAIYLLSQEGMGVREIARHLDLSPTTVMTIIGQKGEIPETVRKDKVTVDPKLLASLYHDCNGRAQRVYEKLNEEQGVVIGYSTVTQLLREQGLSGKRSKRCGREDDVPGAEMQHDTSPYVIRLRANRVNIQASLIYFRYSKIRYLRFYRSFDRFRMKCFFHEALMFWGYAAEVCIIDNTNLARLKGTGKNAVIVPEMARFAKSYQFEFRCHEKGHANRKAGNERGFYTVETNFFPGRHFDSLEDLNHQAFEWATRRSANRPTGKTNLIPSKAFEYEKPNLKKMTAYIEPPYRVHTRGTDQYGYVSFGANYYWVPGIERPNVKALEYADHLVIYQNRKQLGRYLFPPDGVKNEKIAPEGGPKPTHQPKYRKKPTAHEEKELRKLSEAVDAYLSFAMPKSGQPRHRFVREIFRLHRKTAPAVFVQAIVRAHKYRITDPKTLENIIGLTLKSSQTVPLLPDIDPAYQGRETYQEGCFTDNVDLSIYDQEEKDE